MAGGDGSQALVATVAAQRQIPHVVVPAGTRNHFARDLGLDRDDVVGALDAFGDGVERRIDLAEVNGRVFVNNASLGLYAKIVQAPEYRDAKFKTAADTLPDLLGPDATPLDLQFTGPDGTGYPTAHLILVSNDPYEVDHIGGQGTRARLDTGELGVVAARITGPVQARRFVALEAAGQIRRFEGWLEWNTARFQRRVRRPGRDRHRRRGDDHGPAAGLHLAAGCAAGPAAPPRVPVTGRDRGAPRHPVHRGRTGHDRDRAPGSR